MGKKQKRKHLQPLIWGFNLTLLLLFAGVGYLLWERMQHGQNLQEAFSSLVSDSKEKHRQYEKYWEDKNPSPEAPTNAPPPVDMDLLSAGLSQFQGFAVDAEADLYCPELFEEANSLRKKAIRATKVKNFEQAIQYTKQATALYREAESTAEDITLLNKLYEKFTTRADPASIQLMEQYPTEKNRALTAVYKDPTNLGSGARQRVELLKDIIKNYPKETSRALQAQANEKVKTESMHLKEVLSSEDWSTSLQSVQSALDRNVLKPKEAVASLWAVMRKMEGSTKEKTAALKLPLTANTSLSLVYIRATTPYWIGQYEIPRRAVQILTPRSLVDKGNSDDPAYGLSWHDATTFCQKLSSRWKLNVKLPSEEQWAFACRAGSSTPYSFGEDLAGLAHYNKTTWAKPGTYKANDWGLYDMHGNLMEWCREPFDPAQKDGPRALRGGCWKFGPELCRSDARYRYLPHLATEYIGFRIILEE